MAAFAQRAGLPNLILTHFSSRYQLSLRGGSSIDEIESEARVHYSGNLHLARDLVTFDLGKDFSLTRSSEPSPPAG